MDSKPRRLPLTVPRWLKAVAAFSPLLFQTACGEQSTPTPAGGVDPGGSPGDPKAQITPAPFVRPVVTPTPASIDLTKPLVMSISGRTSTLALDNEGSNVPSSVSFQVGNPQLTIDVDRDPSSQKAEAGGFTHFRVSFLVSPLSINARVFPVHFKLTLMVSGSPAVAVLAEGSNANTSGAQIYSQPISVAMPVVSIPSSAGPRSIAIGLSYVGSGGEILLSQSEVNNPALGQYQPDAGFESPGVGGGTDAVVVGCRSGPELWLGLNAPDSSFGLN